MSCQRPRWDLNPRLHRDRVASIPGCSARTEPPDYLAGRVLHHELIDDKITANMKSISVSADTRGLKTTAKRISVACVVCLAICYVSVYLILRNRGIREMRQYDSVGLLYDSVENVERTHDLSIHLFRSCLFAPLNFLDQQLFGCPGPVKSILFDLS